jgi:hypothetical protein
VLRCAFLHDGGGGILLKRLVDKIVAVKSRTFNRKENLTGMDGSSVDGVTGNFQVSRPFEDAIYSFTDFFQR